MIWLLLVSLHLVGAVSYTLLLRKSALGKLPKLLLAAIIQTGVFIPSIVFLFFGNVTFDHSLPQWLLLLLGGFMLAGFMITNVWSLTRLDASIFTIIFNLRLLVTTILGYIVLGELPKPLQIIGGMVILLSILLLNLHRDKRWRDPSILIGLFTMLWFSFHAVLEKYNLSQMNFETYFFTFALIGTIFVWLAIYIRKVPVTRHLKDIHDKKIYWLIGTRAISGYSYVLALKYGSLAVTNHIGGLSVILIVLFGIFTLGEREQMRQKIIASCVAFAGLTLILISRL